MSSRDDEALANMGRCAANVRHDTDRFREEILVVIVTEVVGANDHLALRIDTV